MNSPFITLTHANLNRPVEISKPLIAGFYYADGAKCTFVVSTGGAVFPVTESVEELKALLSTTNKQPKEATHD